MTTCDKAVPLTLEQTQQIQSDFNRDGYTHLPGILNHQEIEELKQGIDAMFTEEHWRENGNVLSDFVALRAYETGRIFEEMLTREPIISLMEALLGKDCHFIASNIIRNAAGQAVDTFHVDDAIMVPVGEGMERHDPRLPMPAFIINVLFALTPIPSVDYGATQYVPGSHYSGRHPNDPHWPNFEGQEPVSILCEPGDVYFFNNQGWHRGAPNTTNTTRYIFSVTYSRRCMAQRLYPFMNYQMPQGVIDNADERRRRVLGFHKSGAYG
jgi:ectoine hydroxylase-related dioxygenase (phytanoyl-CoA dioxygenase family)